MLMDYVNSGVKCIVGCIEVLCFEVYEFGVMVVNENLKVKVFVEKLKDLLVMVGKFDILFVLMGIYVFDVDYFYKMFE